MTTVTSRCERCNVLPPNVVAGTGGAASDVLPDRSQDGTEFLVRQIQNEGSNVVQVAIQDTATTTEYHFQLQQYQILNIPTLGRVSVIAAANFTVSTFEVMKTQDNIHIP